MLEAYIAAIFVDSMFDYTVVEKLFDTFIQPYFVDITLYDTFANRQPTVRQILLTTHYYWTRTDRLQTFLFHQLANVYKCRDACLKVGKIPDSEGQPMILAAVMVHGQSIGEAVGTSSRYAKVRASEKAAEAIKALLPTEFRAKFACDCKSTDMEAQKETKMKQEDVFDVGTAV